MCMRDLWKIHKNTDYEKNTVFELQIWGYQNKHIFLSNFFSTDSLKSLPTPVGVRESTVSLQRHFFGLIWVDYADTELALKSHWFVKNQIHICLHRWTVWCGQRAFLLILYSKHILLPGEGIVLPKTLKGLNSGSTPWRQLLLTCAAGSLAPPLALWSLSHLLPIPETPQALSFSLDL